MPSRYPRAPRMILQALAVLVAACSSEVDPFDSGPAHASVTGVLATSAGAPLGGATIRIGCDGGGMPVDITTDSAGRYLANLETGSDPFDGQSGRLRCQFTEPAAAQARVQFDTALGFARGPVLVVLQVVDLHES